MVDNGFFQKDVVFHSKKSSNVELLSKHFQTTTSTTKKKSLVWSIFGNLRIFLSCFLTFLLVSESVEDNSKKFGGVGDISPYIKVTVLFMKSLRVYPRQ
jgi:hypothetical protein